MFISCVVFFKRFWNAIKRIQRIENVNFGFGLFDFVQNVCINGNGNGRCELKVPLLIAVYLWSNALRLHVTHSITWIRSSVEDHELMRPCWKNGIIGLVCTLKPSFIIVFFVSFFLFSSSFTTQCSVLKYLLPYCMTLATLKKAQLHMHTKSVAPVEMQHKDTHTFSNIAHTTRIVERTSKQNDILPLNECGRALHYVCVKNC